MNKWTFEMGLTYYLRAKKNCKDVAKELQDADFSSVFSGPVLMQLAAYDEIYKVKASKLYDSVVLNSALTEEETVMTMIFLMQYETKYNRMLGYPNLIDQILANTSSTGLFTFGLIETLEAMDEMIYDEYRMLQAKLKAIIDSTNAPDAYKSYATERAVHFNFLSNRYLSVASSLSNPNDPFNRLLNQ